MTDVQSARDSATREASPQAPEVVSDTRGVFEASDATARQELKADLGGRAMRSAAWQGIANVTTAVVRLGVLAVLARELPPSAFGVVAMSAVVTGFAGSIAEFGLGSAVVQRPRLTAAQLWWVFRINLALALGLWGGCALASPWVGRFFHEPLAGPVLAVSAAVLPLSAIALVPRALLTRRLEFKKLAASEIAGAVTNGGVSVATAVSGLGVWSLVAGSLAGTSVSAVLLLVLSPWRPARAGQADERAALLRFGSAIAASALVFSFADQVDKLVVGRMLGSASLGLYAVAFTLAIAVAGQLGVVTRMVAFPAFSAIQDDPDRLAAAYRQCIRLSATLTFPFCTIMAALAPQVIAVFLGPKWALAVVPFRLFLAVGAIRSIYGFALMVLRSVGRPQTELLLQIILCGGVGAAAALGARSGIGGAAGGVAGFVCFLAGPVSIVAASGSAGVGLFGVLRLAAAPGIAAGLAGAVALVGARATAATWPHVSSPVVLGTGLIFGILTYGFALRCAAPDFFAEARRRAWDMLRKPRPLATRDPVLHMRDDWMAEQVVSSVDLALCCPTCGTLLERQQQAWRCTRCAKMWPEREGIPSFLSTEFYWGEIPRPQMQAILDRIRQIGWDEAVHKELARCYPDRYRYIFDPIRADWFYVGNVQARGRALDLGAGWGGLSLRLSRLFDEVVAVEGAWERVKFASMLFRNENARNVQTIHADIHALPLPKESFDLVVMNGVLEWAALGGDETDPETAQQNLLAKVFDLLRPGGSLYIGIENRFALIFLIGGRDHSRPRWMGVLPRSLARWYGRLWGVPRRHPLTHSPSGYKQLLSAAGFTDIRIHAAFPSYSYPRVLVPLHRPSLLAWAARLSLDWRASGLSFPSKVAHMFAASGVVARLACPRAESLVIWARRAAPASSKSRPTRQEADVAGSLGGNPLSDAVNLRQGFAKEVAGQVLTRWLELGLQSPPPSSLSVAQLSGNWDVGGKVTLFICSDSSAKPTLVAKIARTEDDNERNANEHDMLVFLRSLGEEVSRHVPRPLWLWRINDHLVSVQEYVPGRALSRLVARGRPETAVAGVLRLSAPFLTRLALATCEGWCRAQEHPFLDSLLVRAARAAESPECSSDGRRVLLPLIDLARSVPEERLPIVAHHGDLNAADILLCRRRFWVTDWEWSTRAGLPLLDLVTLGISAAARTAGNGHDCLAATMRALIGARPESSREPLTGAQETASAYCLALELSDLARPALAAAAVLNAIVKGREARYGGGRTIWPSDSDPWTIAARALLEAVRPTMARSCE